MVTDVVSDRKLNVRYKVILPRVVVEKHIQDLVGTPVNCSVNFNSHNPANEIGVITAACLRGDRVCVEGLIYTVSRANLISDLARPLAPLGMSFESTNSRPKFKGAEVLEITSLRFTGATILYRSKAAYSATTFTLEN